MCVLTTDDAFLCPVSCTIEIAHRLVTSELILSISLPESVAVLCTVDEGLHGQNDCDSLCYVCTYMLEIYLLIIN